MADNLNLPVVAAAQNQKEVTINAATQQLSSALADFFSIAMAGSNYVLSTANFQDYLGFATTGNTAGNTFTIPASKRALFYIQNGGSASLSVVVGSTSLSVAAGAVGFFQTDGTSNGLVSIVPVPSGGEEDVGFLISGRPLTSQIINYPINQTMSLPVGLTGSNFAIGTNPASTAVFTIYHVVSGTPTSIGTLSIATSGAVTVTFTTLTTFNAGDWFRLVGPSPQDTTLSDVGFNFKFAKA